MPLPLPELNFDLSNHSRDQWFAEMEEVGEEHGYLERLGDNHTALFVDVGPKLLVTFEQMGVIRNRKGSLPRGFAYAMDQGWSVLCLIAEGPTWFRNERVYRYIDRLTDEGFFEDFEETLFYGNHDCGYAAAAFSVASPGARLLAVRPAASLDPAVSRWDRRYVEQRRLDFNSRYGYAPDMIEAAQNAYVAVDPTATADSMHAALFRRPNSTQLNCTYAGPRIEALWDTMGIMPQVMASAMSGRLTPARFGQLWRARRDNGPYLRTLLKRLDRAERPDLALRLCRHGMGGQHEATFAERFNELAAMQSTAAQ